MKLFGVCARIIAVSYLALCAACGGGNTEPPPSPPPPPAGIGAAGGTVNGPSGAQVVVPAGALTTPTAIVVAQSSAGAPALPAGVTSAGQMFAFTPHGTNFASSVTITVPFDPASVPAGTAPTLYKTNAAMSGWDPVPGATVSGSTMSGQVSGFSFATVAFLTPSNVTEWTEKTWALSTYDSRDFPETPPFDADTQAGEVLNKDIPIGRELSVAPSWRPLPSRARLNAFSDAPGRTFFTGAEAPHSLPSDAVQLDTSNSNLTLTYTFKKKPGAASLKFLVTANWLDAIDDGGNAPGTSACPWLANNPTPTELEGCAETMTSAINSFTLKAWKPLSPDPFYSIGGEAVLGGVRDNWDFFVQWPGDVDVRLWKDEDFDMNFSPPHGLGPTAWAALRSPTPIDVPLGSVGDNETFNVVVTLNSYAQNSVQGESFVGAFLRDPQTNAGLELSFSGLEQLAVQHSVAPAPVPQPCTTAADPAAGTLQFKAANFSAPERPQGSTIVIERVGGTLGDVSVLFETLDGTAVAGSDYQGVKTIVRFAGGQDGPRVVRVPFILDKDAEPDETVNLKLSNFSGCATLGAQATATLTILDDDTPPPSVTFTLGGTLSGLTGSGLVLRNVTSGELVNASGSSFTFSGAMTDGSNYNVVVGTQPTNPLQSCSVANGTGTVAGADVTGIVVTCTAPTPAGSLDPTFGDGGRVTSTVEYRANLVGGRIGMALQGDGKILLVGGLKLLRFNADGTADSSFGTAGVVNVVLNNGAFDTAMDVAVQTDGKILVVGTTKTFAIGSDDFALVRYNSDGTVDTTFGSGGKVFTDFFASTDRARRVVLQADGKIVVIGFATRVLSPSVASVDFVIARYNADGSLDTTFSTDGWTVDSPGLSYSVAQGVTIQNDGRIVVVGSTATSGGAPSITGFVRYIGLGGGLQLPGDRDETFGFQGAGVVQASMGGSDVAVDAVTLGDGTILGAVRTSVSGKSAFGIAHLPASGVPAPLFPQPVTKFTTELDEPRCMLKQADGKIVVVGLAGGQGANPDMAIVRYDDSGYGYDTSFGTGGKLTVDFFGAYDVAEAIVQQPDGKLLIGGFATRGGINVFAVTRLAQ